MNSNDNILLAIAMDPNNQDSQTNSPESPESPETDKFTTGEVNPATDEATSDPNATEVSPTFGWNGYAERINGRFAMVGFVALLILELFTHQDFFTWLGL
ncbi:MAG: chlorophyll a/b-binding protein [Leptolyngbyaceae cyanobacterium]